MEHKAKLPLDNLFIEKIPENVTSLKTPLVKKRSHFFQLAKEQQELQEEDSSGDEEDKTKGK